MNAQQSQRSSSGIVMLRLPQVIERAGLKRSAIYKGIKDGKFPAPRKIGLIAMWPEREIDNWNLQRAVSLPPGNGSAPTALYRHFGVGGNLLYVGISLSPLARLRRHNKDSHWSFGIRSVTIEWLSSRKSAEAAEALAIRTESPMCNISKRGVGLG